MYDSKKYKRNIFATYKIIDNRFCLWMWKMATWPIHREADTRSYADNGHGFKCIPKQKLLIVIYGLCIRKVRRWRPLNLATSIGHHRKIIINQTWEQKDAWEKHGWDGGWYAPLSNFNTRTIFFWPTYSFLTNRLRHIDSVKIASLPQYSTLSAHHHHHLECSKLSIFNWSRCRSRTPTVKQSNNAKLQSTAV